MLNPQLDLVKQLSAHLAWVETKEKRVTRVTLEKTEDLVKQALLDQLVILEKKVFLVSLACEVVMVLLDHLVLLDRKVIVVPKVCIAWMDLLDRRVNPEEMDFPVKLVWSDLLALLEAAKDLRDLLAQLDLEVSEVFPDLKAWTDSLANVDPKDLLV